MKNCIALILGMVLVLSMTACVGSSAPGASEVQSSASTNESQAPESVASASSAPVTITMIAEPWQEYAANLDRLFASYKESHPNVTIEYTTDNTVVNARVASKNYPELLVSLCYGNLSPYLEYLTDLTDNALWENIDESVWEAVTFDGRRYAVPLNIETYGLVYNKTMFAEAGFNEPPKTFDQFRQLCEKLVANGITPFGAGFQESWILNQLLMFPFGGSADFVNVANSINDGTTALKNVDYFQSYKPFFDYILKNCQNKALEADYTTQMTLFASEQVAMASNGDWTAGMIDEINPDIQYGMMGVPYSNNEADYKIYVSASNAISVFKDSANREAAQEFAEWLVGSKEGKAWLGSDWKMFTPVKNVDVELNPLSLDGLKAVEGKYSAPWGDAYFPGEANSYYAPEIQKYILGEADWDLMLDNINAAIQKYSA